MSRSNKSDKKDSGKSKFSTSKGGGNYDDGKGKFKKGGKDHGDPKFKKRKGDPLPTFSENIRLNKFIANAGVCSRREADVLIATGIVEVNGKIITEMGYKVKPGDEVKYDGGVLQSEKKNNMFY